MPKQKRDGSLSSDMPSLSSFSCNPTSSKQFKNPLDDDKNMKDWEEARCPVCMEHPHNAILLICSSHGNGCRPFMCNTSSRHSNCFNQFCISFTEPSSDVHPPEAVASSISSLPPVVATSSNAASDLEGAISAERSISVIDINPVKCKLVCPLCRGLIRGWIIVENARDFMNEKVRSCSSETCDYSGAYKDLQEHARTIHPLVRPTDADPERQRNWRRLERRRDLGDLFSSLNTSIGEEHGNFLDLLGALTPAREDDNGVVVSVHLIVLLVRPNARVAVRTRPSERVETETRDGESDSRDDDDDIDTTSERGRRRLRRNIRRRLNPDNDDDNVRRPVNPDHDDEETESDSG